MDNEEKSLDEVLQVKKHSKNIYPELKIQTIKLHYFEKKERG